MRLLLVLLAAAQTAARAVPPRCATDPNAGGRLECRLSARTDQPPPASSHAARAASVVALHTAQVQHDLLSFLQPGARTLEVRRQEERLRLFRDGDGSSGSTFAGVALFSGLVVGAAHAPRPLRVLFDGRAHLGPAVLDGGGMGAGVGGRF